MDARLVLALSYQIHIVTAVLFYMILSKFFQKVILVNVNKRTVIQAARLVRVRKSPIAKRAQKRALNLTKWDSAQILNALKDALSARMSTIAYFVHQ